MQKPCCAEEDEKRRTLQDFVEQFAIGLACDVENGEKTETIQTERKILDSLTNALISIKF
jgi:hypothetical protein